MPTDEDELIPYPIVIVLDQKLEDLRKNPRWKIKVQAATETFLERLEILLRDKNAH